MSNDKKVEDKPKEQRPKVNKAALEAASAVKEKQLATHQTIKK